MLFGKGKAKLILSLTLSLFGVTVAALSTAAWFQINTTNSTVSDYNTVKSGSADINVESVSGHKIVPAVSAATGFTDYTNTTVTKMNGDMVIQGTNYNQDDADTEFDVPDGGIGYYIVTKNSAGNYKFHRDELNYRKFQEFNSGTAMYASDVDLTTTDTFVVRSYQMVNHKTALSTSPIKGLGAGVSQNNASGELTVSSNGRYKIWYDSGSYKLGVERIGDIPASKRLSPDRKNLLNTGNQVIYLKPNDNWKQASAKFALDVFTGGTHSSVLMSKESNDYYYATVPSGTWSKIIFCRLNSTATDSDVGSKFPDKKWNQSSDLDFPSDPNNCWTLGDSAWEGDGSWLEHHSLQLSIGDESSYSDMTWKNGQWEKTSVSVTDGQKIYFKKYGVSETVTKASGDDQSTWNANNISSCSSNYVVIGKGGTVNIYFHTDNTIWISSIDVVTVKIGSNDPVAMNYDSVKDEYYYSASGVSAGAAIEFKYSGAMVLSGLTKQNDSGNRWYDKNNFNPVGATVPGGGDVTIYLHKDFSVWVTSCVEITADGGTNWHQMSWNSTTSQFEATGIDVTEGGTVAMQVNGSAYTDFVADSGYNNVSSDKKIVKDAVSAGFYLKNRDAANPQLWVDGNQVYQLKIGSGGWEDLTYIGSGDDHLGWYKLEDQTVNTSDTLSVRLNGGDAITGTSAGSMSNNNYAGGAIVYGGTGVTIYYDVSNKKFEVTPVYHISVGATELQASSAGGGVYQCTFGSVSGGASVVAKINGSAQSYSAESARDAGATRNNCTGSAGAISVIYDTSSSTVVSFNTTYSTLWVDGYAPCYYVSVNGGTWQKMTDAGDNAQVYLSISASAGDTLSFRKNASGVISAGDVSAKEAVHLNNFRGDTDRIYTGITNKRIYFNYTNNEVWVPGRLLTYYFYNEAASANAYLFNSAEASIHGTAFPGDTLSSSSNIHTLEYIVPENVVYNRVIFNLGSSANQSVDIDISAANYDGMYCRFTTLSDSKWNVDWHSNPPDGSGGTKLYVFDSFNGHFGGNPYAYIWNNTSGARIPYGNSAFPGVAMTEVIPRSLWSIDTNASSYDRVLFSVSGGGKKTADISFNAESNGKVWVSSGVAGSTINGGFTTEKTANVGTARIYISSDEGENWVSVDRMFLGDNDSSNKFIYERGIEAIDGDLLKVVVTNLDESTTNYDRSASTDDNTKNRTYLSCGDSSIKVNLKSGEKARFNFYITTENKLAIVMVPWLGNGFYIMDYDEGLTTDTYSSGVKMTSSSDYTASYSGYYVDGAKEIFIRSYLNAEDTLYTTLVDNTSRSVASISDGVISISAAGYYNISVAGGKVFIEDYQVNAFFALNPLDTSNADDSSSIKGQLTSLVLEVTFTCNNNYDSYISLDVTNGLSYTGCALYATDEAVDDPELGRSAVSPYNFMRDNCYGALSSASSISNQNVTNDIEFKVPSRSSATYYAYILIDYLPSNDWSSYPNLASNMSFYLRSSQA